MEFISEESDMLHMLTYDTRDGTSEHAQLQSFELVVVGTVAISDVS